MDIDIIAELGYYGLINTVMKTGPGIMFFSKRYYESYL